jgi:hypothetical protein
MQTECVKTAREDLVSLMRAGYYIRFLMERLMA